MSEVLRSLQILLAYLRPVYSGLALFLAMLVLFVISFLSLFLLFAVRVLS